MLKEIEIDKFNFNNEKLEHEIYRFIDTIKNEKSDHVAKFEIMTNVGGDQLHIGGGDLDESKWPYLRLFKEEIIKFYNLKNKPYIWLNINYPKCYNTLHSHDERADNCLVYYVKVPEDSGDIIFVSIDGEKTISPKENMILKFPPGLCHCVEPNFSEDNRISIAMNING